MKSRNNELNLGVKKCERIYFRRCEVSVKFYEYFINSFDNIYYGLEIDCKPGVY